MLNLNRCVDPYHKKGWIAKTFSEDGELTEYRQIDDHDIPCGVCLPCLKRKSMEWAFRIHQENRRAVTSSFITLTYDTRNLPIVDSRGIRERLEGVYRKRAQEKVKHEHVMRAGELTEDQLNDPNYRMSLCKPDARLFIDRVRKRVRRKGLENPKHFLVGEYGSEGGRGHLHAIMFNVPPDIECKYEEIWGKGWVDVREVVPERIQYIAKYVHKKYDEYKEAAQPFQWSSQGLGGNYLTDAMVKFHLEGSRFYAVWNGHKVRLPRYYAEKIWDLKNEDFDTRINAKAAVRANKISQQNEALKEYWKEYVHLGTKGIKYPDRFMETRRDENINRLNNKYRKRQ